tara:strand:- start:59 stop:1213 length:1155 start_codon:yes stop_codon:yes gene_type:complete
MIYAILCAAGAGTRIKNKDSTPKQYIEINNRMLLEYSLEKFYSNKRIDHIFLLLDKKYLNFLNQDTFRKFEDKTTILIGGETRQETVYEALKYIEPRKPSLVFIHDCARPNFSADMINILLEKINNFSGIIPVLKVADTLKHIDGENLITIDRNKFYLSQTPQLFKFTDLYNSHNEMNNRGISNITDDSQVCEILKLKINTIESSFNNYKITNQEDLDRFKAEHEKINMRVGIGFDVHRFQKGNKVRLFGLDIPYNKSLAGHSDADVGLHAITDAIYGSLGLEDIGYYFNPEDSKWKDIDSSVFLEHAKNKLIEQNVKINNLDIIVICEEPNISNYKKIIKESISTLLSIEIRKISLKATTTEGLGFTGRKEGIAVQAMVTIIN